MFNWKQVTESFTFLRSFDFEGPIIYPNGSEVNFDYISPYSIVNITYEPGYEFLTRFIKLKKRIENEDLTQIRWKKLRKSEYKTYDLALFLDPKNKLRKTIVAQSKGDENLVYYSTLLKTNPKLLEHNFDDLKTCSLIIKLFK